MERTKGVYPIRTQDIIRDLLDNNKPHIEITQPSGLDYIAAAIVVRAARAGHAETRLRDIVEGTYYDTERNDQKTA